MKWHTEKVWEETHEKIIGLKADAEKHLKRSVSIGETVDAIVNYALTQHEHGDGPHHLVWVSNIKD